MFDLLALPERTAKPCESGLNHVLDTGLSLDQVRQLLDMALEPGGILKLGWGDGRGHAQLSRDEVALYHPARRGHPR